MTLKIKDDEKKTAKDLLKIYEQGIQKGLGINQQQLMAGAYDQFKPDKWAKDYTNDSYRQLGVPIPPQGMDSDEVYEQLKLPLKGVKRLQINPEQFKFASDDKTLTESDKFLFDNFPRDRLNPQRIKILKEHMDMWKKEKGITPASLSEEEFKKEEERLLRELESILKTLDDPSLKIRDQMYWTDKHGKNLPLY